MLLTYYGVCILPNSDLCCDWLIVMMIRVAHGVQGVWGRVRHAGALGCHWVCFTHPAAFI